jgi:IS5 family transposase
MKRYSQLTCEESVFHLEDSESFRIISRLGMGKYPCTSNIQVDIKSLRQETWEKIQREIIGCAKNKCKINRKVRIDAIPMETEIYHPADSTNRK